MAGRFALIWLVTVAISAEFVSVAFLLWLLAGHLLPVRWGLVFSALVLGVVILTPILHDGSTSYANIFGPTIGGVFAFGVSLGYLQLLRDAVTREELVASLTKAQAEMSELHDELARTQRHSGMIAERTQLGELRAGLHARQAPRAGRRARCRERPRQGNGDLCEPADPPAEQGCRC